MRPVRRIATIFSGMALVGAMLFSSACLKTNVKWVNYDETRCDKWEHNNNNEKLKENFVNYYRSKGVKIYEVEIFSDRDAETCIDCSCKTGRRFNCKVPKGDVKEVKKDGFYE